MKKLLTNKGTFGPFTSIAITQEAYLADGIIYPFTVVGTGVIVDWEGDIPAPPVLTPEIIVPESLEPAQARLILLKYDLLDEVENIVALASKEIQIMWNFRKSIKRNSPELNQVWALLNRTQEELDELFIEGAKL